MSSTCWAGVKRYACQPRNDFVLHVEEIGQRLVEPLGPKMIARFGVDALDVDAHAVSAVLNAALQHIADIQLAPDRLHVERLDRSIPSPIKLSLDRPELGSNPHGSPLRQRRTYLITGDAAVEKF